MTEYEGGMVNRVARSGTSTANTSFVKSIFLPTTLSTALPALRSVRASMRSSVLVSGQSACVFNLLNRLEM